MYPMSKLRPPWLRVLGHRKETVEKYKWYGRIGLASIFLTACLFLKPWPSQQEYVIDSFRSSRHLLSTATLANNTVQNCSAVTESANHTIPEWEKCELELANAKEAWVVFYLFCILALFVAIAIVCDDFFVPSLEVISEKLHLSEDVAGATFMAAGSSAPELFTSVAGVSYETDVGIGTIVGSAVFNILVIIALTAALSGQILHLDWRPMTRDSVFYALSIACFIYFSWDGQLDIWEAVILLALYILYIIIMVINRRLMDWMATWRTGCKKVKVEPTTEDGEASRPGTAPEQAELERKKSVCMSGGHARRLSIISHRSSIDGAAGSQDKHIFHHTRQGSISGSFRGAVTPNQSPQNSPPPFHTHSHKDSGFQSTEPSYIPSNDTSRTDLHDSPEYHDYINEDYLKPPHVVRKKPGTSVSSSDGPRCSTAPPRDLFHADVHNVTTIEDTLDLMKRIDKARGSIDSMCSGNNVTYSNDSRPNSNSNSLLGRQDSENDVELELNSRRNLPPLESVERPDSDHFNLPNCSALPPIVSDSNPNGKRTLTFHHSPGESDDSLAPLSIPRVFAPSLSHTDTASGHSETQGTHIDSQLHAYQPQEGTITEGEEEEEAASKNGDKVPHIEEKDEDGEDDDEMRTMRICPCKCCIPIRGSPPVKPEAVLNNKYCSKKGWWPWSVYIVKWFLFILSFPFLCLFTWTIPDCSKPHNRKCFIASFLMSVIWIIILSFALITVVGRTGCILNIDSYTMGLVVVAIGTSVPDALSSILVARDGYGDMAVSNAIGSNVFDINLGLGLPFLIRIAIKGPVSLVSAKQRCYLDQNSSLMVPHAKFGFILLLILVFVQIAFLIARFKLRKQIGIFFVILYALFLCYAFVQEIHCQQIFC